jgi:hypothetical protein
MDVALKPPVAEGRCWENIWIDPFFQDIYQN